MTDSVFPWVYDLETFPNVFTFTAMQAGTGFTVAFEISERRDDVQSIFAFLQWIRDIGAKMIGFNNVGFDYPVLHALMFNGAHTAPALYDKAQSIFNRVDRFGSDVKPWEVAIPQIDLYLINHFDNVARSTGLKALEIAMRSHSVEDLPFAPGTPLHGEQIDTLLEYNFHDVAQTMRFYYETLPMIEFRDSLSVKYGQDFTNYNDTKIGKQYFIMKLEEAAPGSCYTKGEYGGKRPNQTVRHHINLADVILPIVQFDHPEFQRIHAWFRAQTITETKGVFKDINATIDGFTFDFGVGGIHGSRTFEQFTADDDFCILDIDVTSYYPSLAISNNLRPAHLGDAFATIYADMKAQRVNFAKGTPENAMLKLALNGVYGDSNNKYSPFYDSQYTMSITINGQLLLCMLAEKLMTLPDLEMMQINTDGMTMRVRRSLLPAVRELMKWWEQLTGLDLEEAEYSRMWIRDVNNYIAEYAGGGVKRKGAYEYKLAWHQDPSALVVQRAAEAFLTEGTPVEQFIAAHDDPFDFMIRGKVPRSSHLELGDGTRLASIIRYYIATDGQPLFKVMPPKAGRVLGDFKQATGVPDHVYEAQNKTGIWNPSIHTKNRSMYETRRSALQSGYLVADCSRADAFDWSRLNRQYYVTQAKKLVDGFVTSS